MKTVSVIGAGAWGTALASVAVQAGLKTHLWAREPEVVAAIQSHGENTPFLPGHALPAGLFASTALSDAKEADFILLVAPAQHLRQVSEGLKDHIRPGCPVLICAKGIENSTGDLMSDVLAETLPENPALVLSGPTFASDVVKGLPSALTLAGTDTDLVRSLIGALALPTFRIYSSTDVVGAQIGGAIKNVLAIATGLVAGLGFGENARAAVITRGLAEMMRFGALYGAERETLMGLSGTGDLILTCSSTQSRNMSLGKALGEGQSFSDIMAERTSVAEGAHTVEVVNRIAVERGIDMPLTAAVHAILYGGADVGAVVETLLARPFTHEAR